jgi:GMP synthase-like glutamine amidotransferase
MKAHILLHVPFEEIGSIAPFLECRSAEVSYTRFYESPQLPDLNSIDLIVVMGGPMSVTEEDRFPWLKSEKRFIREAILLGIPVLGICLGAQLIASAMGARVYRNPVKEIGWFPVRAVPAPAGMFQFPKECLAFHWHGETFDLPAGAVRLAESDACENQAFQLGRNVLGLQFHLETTFESASALLEYCRDELVPAPYVKSEQEIRAIPPGAYQAVNAVMQGVLSYLSEK